MGINLATISNDELVAMGPEKIRALIASMAAQSDRKLSLKVTDKGGVSLYGLGRFPVTLYASQWDKLIGAVDQIKAFVDTNRSLLSTKD